jgi:linoleoyl-CoA desaturase
MKIKTIFMICLYFTPFILMLTGVVTSLWAIMLMWAIMGLGMSGIGLSIMHDANHGSYSKNDKVNRRIGWIIHFIGGYRENWKIQHNVLHHSFTNIDHFDEDIDSGAFRLAPSQKRYWFHNLQLFYAPILYGFMTIYWSIGKDFEQIFRYNKKHLLEGQGLTLKKALAQVIFNKVWYFALFLVLPILILDLAWWQTLLGYLMMHFICGSLLAYVFQCAHVLKETEFYEAKSNDSMENNWAIHQMKTTANFANKSKWLTWLIGGLNYQVEHHLFPNICHVHYPHIAKIVKETAAEFKVPYYHHKTFFGALKSHFSVVYQLGTGKYDRKLAKSKATQA